MANSSKQKEKKERFNRLAEHRTNEVLKKLHVLGHCANRSAYSYGEEEITKIFTTIEKQLRDTKSKFHFPTKTNFKL